MSRRNIARKRSTNTVTWHLDDWIARRDQFQNELVIAAHFSVRYTADQVERVVRKKIPDMLDGRPKNLALELGGDLKLLYNTAREKTLYTRE